MGVVTAVEFTAAHRHALSAAFVAAEETERERRDIACDMFVAGRDDQLAAFEPLVAQAAADRQAIDDLANIAWGLQ